MEPPGICQHWRASAKQPHWGFGEPRPALGVDKLKRQQLQPRGRAKLLWPGWCLKGSSYLAGSFHRHALLELLRFPMHSPGAYKQLPPSPSCDRPSCTVCATFCNQPLASNG